MAPDLNSLPSSSPVVVPLRTRSMTATNGSTSTSGEHIVPGESPSPSPRSASTSLQATATMNAGLQYEPGRRPSAASIPRQRQSPQTGRRRSTVLMNLQLNDPTLPAPGEMVADGGSNAYHAISPQSISSSSPLLTARDPHHNRTPSLGELHQELEAEQEAHVNRLLQMIRQQQLQLQQLQAQSSVAGEDPPPSSDRSASASQPAGVPPSLPTSSSSVARSPSISHPRSSFDIARDPLHRRSTTPSRPASSPRQRSTSIISQEGDLHLSGVRDEATYYQAETQSLIRENQMLRHRIRELERQLSEAHTNASITREPVQPSHLTHSTSVSEDDHVAVSPLTTQLATTSETKDE
ncbi:hypothetical protein GGR50DRAFT_672160 [Xylaria sp. CBS 124048]|nr:hypothetical protein GGR50DRAFT_672160 [Xylaria sp. CBS 124048]